MEFFFESFGLLLDHLSQVFLGDLVSFFRLLAFVAFGLFLRFFLPFVGFCTLGDIGEIGDSPSLPVVQVDLLALVEVALRALEYRCERLVREMLIQDLTYFFLAGLSALELLNSVLNHLTHLGWYLLAEGLQELGVHFLLCDSSSRKELKTNKSNTYTSFGAWSPVHARARRADRAARETR